MADPLALFFAALGDWLASLLAWGADARAAAEDEELAGEDHGRKHRENVHALGERVATAFHTIDASRPFTGDALFQDAWRLFELIQKRGDLDFYSDRSNPHPVPATDPAVVNLRAILDAATLLTIGRTPRRPDIDRNRFDVAHMAWTLERQLVPRGEIILRLKRRFGKSFSEPGLRKDVLDWYAEVMGYDPPRRRRGKRNGG